jgi:hypothetical protein
MAITLVDLLRERFAPIQLNIILCLDVGATVALLRTCKQRDLRPLFNRTIYNNDRHLKRWFENQRGFRELQRELDIPIIHSFAGAFLAGVVDQGGYLSLVIERDDCD